ncbi:hypothetical protein FGO68_gene12908 [Halteria grandinella]|uniref:Uncharacterized protein n=1 Tax=Halteria grandinella TaxID=5974 RepID=A0A8J8T2Q7_HALGN|nr:hypothetical protein FGO68_gene12908 [Halteria grandinella]
MNTLQSKGGMFSDLSDTSSVDSFIACRRRLYSENPGFHEEERRFHFARRLRFDKQSNRDEPSMFRLKFESAQIGGQQKMQQDERHNCEQSAAQATIQPFQGQQNPSPLNQLSEDSNGKVNDDLAFLNGTNLTDLVKPQKIQESCGLRKESFSNSEYFWDNQQCMTQFVKSDRKDSFNIIGAAQSNQQILNSVPMKVQRFEKAASLLSLVDKIEDNSDKAFLNKSSTVIKEEEVNGAHTDHEDDFLQAE